MGKFLLEMTEERHKELEEFAHQIGIDDVPTLVNAAITLFRWAANETGQGRSIASIDNITSEAQLIDMMELPPY